MNTQKIIENVDLKRFKNIISKNKIVVGAHALEHISSAQRKIYAEDTLIKPLQKERPFIVGLQKNGRYAVYYKRDDYYLKIILAVNSRGIEIITFINALTVPNLKGL